MTTNHENSQQKVCTSKQIVIMNDIFMINDMSSLNRTEFESSLKRTEFEMSSLWNILAMKCPTNKTFFRMKCRVHESLVYKMSCLKMSYLWNDLSIKYPVITLFWLSNVLPMKCLTNELSVHEMSYQWTVLQMKCPTNDFSCQLQFLPMNYLSMKCPKYLFTKSTDKAGELDWGSWWSGE